MFWDTKYSSSLSILIGLPHSVTVTMILFLQFQALVKILSPNKS